MTGMRNFNILEMGRELDVLEEVGKEFLKVRNSSVVSVTLTDGEPVPSEFEQMKPIAIVATEDKITLWFLREGHLKRIK